MTPTDPSFDPVRRHLIGLPDPMPPDAVRARLVEHHAARFRRRRWPAPIRLAAVACIGALLFVSSSWFFQRHDTDIGAERAASHAEADRQVDGRTNGPTQDMDLIQNIRSIDRQLQAAYERGASPDELVSLWSMRESLLARGGIGHAAKPVRI